MHVLHINLAVPDTQAGLLNVGLFNFLYLFRSQIMILFLHRVFFSSALLLLLMLHLTTVSSFEEESLCSF